MKGSLGGQKMSLKKWFFSTLTSFKKYRNTESDEAPKPVIYVWPVNGVVGVVPAWDFEFWQTGWRRIEEVCMLSDIPAPHGRPSPAIIAIFTDCNGFGPWRTGSLNDFRRIAEGCVIMEGPMHIPLSERSMLSHRKLAPVTLEAAWILIHGHPDSAKLAV